MEREISLTVQVKESPDGSEATEQITDLFSKQSERAREFMTSSIIMLPDSDVICKLFSHFLSWSRLFRSEPVRITLNAD